MLLSLEEKNEDFLFAFSHNGQLLFDSFMFVCLPFTFCFNDIIVVIHFKRS